MPRKKNPTPSSWLPSLPPLALLGGKKNDPVEQAEKAVVQLTEHQQKAKTARKAEVARIKTITDSEFWVALCFESRAQKDTFLKAIGLFGYGDKYLDGRLFAEAAGIELPKPAKSKMRTKGAKALDGLY
jgi:hypothetical protein